MIHPPQFPTFFLLITSLSVTVYAEESTVKAPRYVVNLDLEPQDRWSHVVADYKTELQYLLKGVEKLVGHEAMYIASIIGKDVDKHVPYPYSQEMVGISKAGDVTVGETVLGNFIYELTAFNKSKRFLHGNACTSIVAEATNGTIYHGRNLDYSIADLLRNMTITVDFQKSNKIIYTGTTFVGYVGLLTGQRPLGFTISLDERNEGDWWMNAAQALQDGVGAVAAFLIRDTLYNAADYQSAVAKLAYEPLIAPCYLIVGGMGSDEGVVITRNRIAALDIWQLDTSKGRWFLVETNYDHWEPPPASDDRRDPAIKMMNETGRNGVSVNAIYDILSTYPVLNNGTSYTVTMSAAIPELYNTWIRYP